MTAPTIQLRPIDKTNWKTAARLKLGECQEKFVAPNWYSILEAIYSDGTLHSRGIYDGDDLVGYVMYGVDPDTGWHWIVRLMTDFARQKQGYGRAAMSVIIEEIKQRYQCDAIYISFEPENSVARGLYASLSFQDTGLIIEEEVVYKLTL